MKSAGYVEKLLCSFYSANKNLVKTDAEMDKVIMSDALIEFEKNNKKQTGVKLNKWRYILKTRITRIAVASGIIILAVVCVWALTGIEKSDLKPTTKHSKEVVDKKGRGRSNRMGTMGIKPIDRKKMKDEAEKIRKMASLGDIDGLVTMLSARNLQNKVAAAEHLGRIGDERALPKLKQLNERFVCGLSKKSSTIFKNNGYGYKRGITSGAFAVAMCKIMTRNLSEKEQIDAWFELLEDYMEPEMDPSNPYLAISTSAELLDIPINKFGYGCYDLGKRVAAELEKYDDPSIVARLRTSDNKGAAITAVWMEIKDLTVEEAIGRCVEIVRNERSAQQYGAIKCLGKLGEDAVYALDDLAMEGHYEAMRMLGYHKKNQEVLKMICWHLANNGNYLVRLLAISQFSVMNIQRYQQPILLQTLLEALYDPKESVRRSAARLLRTVAKGKNGSRLLEYEDDLLVALKHPDKEVRVLTAQTLKRLGSKRMDEEVPDPPEIRKVIKVLSK